MAGINAGGPTELAVLTLMRARCCETVGNTVSNEHGSEMFLLGLCSLLDAILDRPMEEIVTSLPLSGAVRDALLGQHNTARAVLDAVVAYEHGDWDAIDSALGANAGARSELASAYRDSLPWACELSSAA